jgi:hypothetical protein
VQGSGVPVQSEPVHVQPGDPSMQLLSANEDAVEVNAASHDAVPVQVYCWRHPTPIPPQIASLPSELHCVATS